MHSDVLDVERSAAPSTPAVKILVIDDEIGPRESLRMILKDSYEIVCSDSGEMGVEEFRGGGFDLVLLDLKMKKLNGLETLEKLKEMDPSINVIILTGYGTLETAQRAIRLGASDYVSKPFDVVEISKTVKATLAKRREEREKVAAVEKFKTLNRHLAEEIQSLQKLLSSQDRYCSFFHEICNPLTSVMGYVQILLLDLEEKMGFGKEDRERAYTYLRIIEKEMERCRLMFRSFSSLPKKSEEKPAPLPLHKLIEEILILIKPQMETSGIRAETDLDASLAEVTVQSGELRQVLLNLCINSIHAMEGGGKLTLSAKPVTPESIEIAVADTGCGMDENVLQKAFQPFFTTKGSEVGSGLGLAISKNIIEKLGGTIQISSRKGTGTTITLSIPRQAL